MSDPLMAARSVASLGNSRFLNLDAPVRALVEPAGLGGASLNPAADDGPAVLVHENYILIHWPGRLNEIEEIAKIAERVRGGVGGY